MTSWTPRTIVTHDGTTRTTRSDHVAIEEPLEVRVNGEPYAITMRTPGDDRALAAGFLLSERLIEGRTDIDSIAHHPGDVALANRINVVLTPEATERAGRRLAARRQTLTTSACGLCGRLTFDTMAGAASRLSGRWTISAATLVALPAALAERQAAFQATGGVHAAGLFRPDGTLVDHAEDVGRHNAVDKLVGRALLDDRLPLSAHVLVVSSRASFEVLQKAWLGGVHVVAAVSAPSSLAIELAERAGITLAGFVRNTTLNLYTHAARVV
jgi:FdhD protein